MCNDPITNLTEPLNALEKEKDAFEPGRGYYCPMEIRMTDKRTNGGGNKVQVNKGSSPKSLGSKPTTIQNGSSPSKLTSPSQPPKKK
ncbi:hypothetical protein [Haematobacter missouriensis]|uniref:hypothetical protein n=1 Tax=Haematobacter missouriensis TaxID=366616 RepID=UPI00117B09FF|nr:hypothetical protein [Haematobacter missouriensis]